MSLREKTTVTTELALAAGVVLGAVLVWLVPMATSLTANAAFGIALGLATYNGLSAWFKVRRNRGG